MYTAKVLNNKVLYTHEEEYTGYFDNTATGVFYLDGALRIKNLNREAERIFCLDRSQVIGRSAKSVFGKYGDALLKMCARGFEQGDSANVKLRMNDQLVYLHVDTLKIIDASGVVSGIIIIMQDMSAVRAAIKQIQTTQMLLSLGELAAGVAHHVRTPLTTIGGYLQVMLNRLQDDQYTVRREVLEMLLGEVSYISDVVKELVMFAKPTVQKKDGVRIETILAESLRLVFNGMDGEHIQIRRQIAENLPALYADVNLLQQALVNILQNAVEAMGGEGVLMVRAWRNAENNMLVVAIADTGPGIAPELLPRIFEPFYTSKLDRMGLGLPVAHRIVTEHGGFINITAGGDGIGGTRAHIYLPLFEDKTRRLSVVHQQVLNLQ